MSGTTDPRTAHSDIASRSEDLARLIRDEVIQEIIEKKAAIAAEVRAQVLKETSAEISKALAAHTTRAVQSSVLEGFKSDNVYEHRVEQFVYGSRWFMVPAYAVVGLVLALVAFYIIGDAYKILMGVLMIFATKFPVLGLSEHIPYDASFVMSVAVLKILDTLMLTSLIVMVLIGGYENTISKIQKGLNSGPSWVGNLDLHRLKTKIAAAIVLISSIHLLQMFMKIEGSKSNAFDWNVMWTVLIHIVFVLSALGLAYIDKMISSHKHTEDDA